MLSYIYRRVSIQKKCFISLVCLLVLILIEQLLFNSSNPLANIYGIRVHSITRLLNGFFYIPLGICLAQRSVLCIIKTWELVLMVICSMLIRQIDILLIQYLSDMICSVSLFLLVIRWKGLNRCNQKFFITIRSISSYMYYLHMYVWTILCFVLLKELSFGRKVFVLTTSLSMLLSFFIVLIREKLSISHKGHS